MELVNIWEDYIRISLGWKITTFGEKNASLQLSECFSYWSRIDCGRKILARCVTRLSVNFKWNLHNLWTKYFQWKQHGKACNIGLLFYWKCIVSKEHAVTLGVNCIKLKLSRNYLKFSCRICSVVKISIFRELDWQLQAAFESTLPLLVCHFRKSIRYFPRRNNLRGKKDLPFLENTFILFCIVRIHTLANLPSSIFSPYQ